jgi:AcrR family transcriptional regulator
MNDRSYSGEAMPRSTKPTPPPTARGEATRAKLIETAHRLFLKHGFHGTSMRQIADKAGLALGGIYNHFANKEAIFAAVLDAYHPYHVMMPALENAQGEDAETFMRDAAERVRASIEQARADTKLLPLLFMEIVEFQGRHIKDIAERLFPTILGFIQRFVERRDQVRDLPAPVILRAFAALMIGYILTELILKNSTILKQGHYHWFDGMVDIFLHGIIRPSEV